MVVLLHQLQNFFDFSSDWSTRARCIFDIQISGTESTPEFFIFTVYFTKFSACFCGVLIFFMKGFPIRMIWFEIQIKHRKIWKIWCVLVLLHGTFHAIYDLNKISLKCPPQLFLHILIRLSQLSMTLCSILGCIASIAVRMLFSRSPTVWFICINLWCKISPQK